MPILMLSARAEETDRVFGFECGADDHHVPPDGALRFKKALGGIYSSSPEKLRVNLHPDVKHAVVPEMVENCFDWFASHKIV